MLYFKWLGIHFLQILNRYFLCILEMHPHFNRDWCIRNYCKSSLSSLYATILKLHFSTDIHEMVQIINKQYVQQKIISTSNMTFSGTSSHDSLYLTSIWQILNNFPMKLNISDILQIYIFVHVYIHTHIYVSAWLTFSGWFYSREFIYLQKWLFNSYLMNV
jgi:hypothetical protein